MTGPIEGIGDRREPDEPLVWKPWQPPVMPPTFVPSESKEDGVGGVEAVSAAPAMRISGDRHNLAALTAQRLAETDPADVDLDALAVPLTPEAQAVAHAIGELGVVNAVGQVATAVARSTFAPDRLAESLGQFADNLSKASGQLMALPGVGDALQAFGGVGGVVAGATGLKQELDDIKAKGLGPQQALGVAARAAQLVGGFAMALSPLCPPLAPAGAAIMTAGAALSLGKLGWEHRDDLKRVAKIVSDQGAAIVSNNGASMVGDRPNAWQWVTG